MARTASERPSAGPGGPDLSPRTWTLRFEGSVPPGPNARPHWYTRAGTARQWKELALVRCYLQDIPHLKRIRISAVIYRKRLGVADEDNDRARLKPVIDGIVAAGVVPNDTRQYVEHGPMTEVRGAPALVVIIEEL
jgi:hypothetical protein